MVLAQFDPTATLMMPVITAIKSDIVMWGTVFIGVSVAMYAYNRVLALVEEREHQNEEDDERDEQIEEYHSSRNRAEADDDYDYKYQ